MYTKEELFTSRMIDYHRMVIPQKHNGDDWKFNQLMPEHITPYDRFDPFITQEIRDWIRGSEVTRSELTLGSFTTSNCTVSNVTTNPDGTTNLDVTLDGNLYASIETGDILPTANEWYLVEYRVSTPEDRKQIIVVTSNGNYNVDSAGGLPKRFDEPQYDDAKETIVELPHYWEDNPNYDHNLKKLHIGFRNGRAGDIIKIENLAVYKVTAV